MGESPGGEPDLAISNEEIDPVAEAARALRGDLADHGLAAEADTRQAGDDLTVGGADSGTALTALATAWRRQCENLMTDCDRLSGDLDSAMRAFVTVDHDIRGTLQRVRASSRHRRSSTWRTSSRAGLRA